MLMIKLGFHKISLKQRIYLAQHYLNQHEVSLRRHSTCQLCGNTMTAAIDVDSSRITHQRKQRVAACMGAQQQLGQHTVIWSRKKSKCDTISYLRSCASHVPLLTSLDGQFLRQFSLPFLMLGHY